MDRPPRLNLPLPTLGGMQIWADLYVYAGHRIQENVVTGHHRLLGPRNVRLAWGTFEECLDFFASYRERHAIRRQGNHLVLLLHGMFRAKEAFNPMRTALLEAGYEAEAINYPSTQATVESHADQLERLLDRMEGIARVSFVSHSLGGLVARELLGRRRAWRKRIEVHRLVMIATPNRGAHMADRLLPLWAYRRLAGPAAAQLTAEYVQTIPLPTCRFGIVAGARGDGEGYNPLLPGDDDMTVSVESTMLEGAEDILVVNAIHTFIIRNPEVVASTVRYLASGRFAPPE